RFTLRLLFRGQAFSLLRIAFHKGALLADFDLYRFTFSTGTWNNVPDGNRVAIAPILITVETNERSQMLYGC
ncbi:hypothetical protein MJM95_27395, partial [Salmonella enterica subsp. enterica serovar Anatum]|nr:hypothetical protein [Salmonella enterica subsp. enterica serovar Anatum]